MKPDTDLRVRLMGPTRAIVDGRVVELGGPKKRVLLTALALSAGAALSTDRLIELVWDDAPPATARRTLQSHVAALRGALGGRDSLRPAHDGYLLDVERRRVDLLEFEDDVSAALHAEPDVDLPLLDAALSAWQAPFVAQSGLRRVVALLAPFEELHLLATEELVAAQIDGGRAGEAVGRLEALVREHPTRENLWLQLARCRAVLGRRDSALRTIQRAREALREELGVDPAVQLTDLEQTLVGASRRRVRLTEAATPPSSPPMERRPTGHRRYCSRVRR